MRIILDGMGGDNAPGEIVKGAVEASKLIEDEIVIVGDGDKIEFQLKKYKYSDEKRQRSNQSTSTQKPSNSCNYCNPNNNRYKICRHNVCHSRNWSL